MQVRIWALSIAAALLAGTAQAETANSLHCVITSCSPQENCRPVSLNGTPFDPSAGNDYIFGLTDKWTLSATSYVLDRVRFTGETSMERTVLSITVDAATHDMHLELKANAAGSSTIAATATGHCDISHSLPILF